MRVWWWALALVVGCGREGDAPPTVRWFTASSVTPLVEEISDRFEATTGIPVVVNVASTSILARQLSAGVAGDVFLSAHHDWVEYVSRALDREVDSRPWLSNRLVFVEPVDVRRSHPLPHLDPSERVAIADPSHVPLGLATRSWLERLGWWHDWEGRMIYAPNARAALGYVESGDVTLGVSTRAEARASARVRPVPHGQEPAALQYEVVTLTAESAATRRFVAFLFGATVDSLATAAGYEPAGQGS